LGAISIFLLVPLFAIVIWQIAVLPTVTVHYPVEGEEKLRFVWNVQDRIYKGRMPPGSAVSDDGFLMPDEDFFMVFSWHSEKGRWHCISITPEWPRTHIYLDVYGNIDMRKESGTDIDRLKRCEWDKADP
jgi:hypothetical protein